MWLCDLKGGKFNFIIYNVKVYIGFDFGIVFLFFSFDLVLFKY